MPFATPAADAVFDYVVVGGGSAGCVVAARLSEKQETEVLLIEAGPRNEGIWLRIPIGIAKVVNDRSVTWQAATDPEPGLGGRVMPLQTGRVLGGSSSINGMIHVRGQAERFDEWRDGGCAGWGYEDLLPYFKRLERCSFETGPARGRDGAIGVSTVPPNRLSTAFIDACVRQGVPRVDDYNSSGPGGAAQIQLSVRNGVRCSSATGYAQPALKRKNLSVLTGAVAVKVAFAGRRAVGVFYRRNGQIAFARARAEVLLCAGALRSPQLLELSGVGNPQILRSHGIEVIHALPGVGENAQDHLMGMMSFECHANGTANDIVRSLPAMATEICRYLLRRQGFFATSSFPALAFTKALPDDPYATVRLQLGLSSGPSRLSTKPSQGLDAHPGFHIGGYHLFPRSRGNVHIQSPDAEAAPRISMNYLSDEFDQRMAIRVLSIIRGVASEMKQEIVRQVRPSAALTSPKDLLSHYRSTGHTCWHPVGTCRMGSTSQDVVDANLRVRGLEALRIIDASIMPFHVSSNTNIPVIAIAEKAADLVRGCD